MDSEALSESQTDVKVAALAAIERIRAFAAASRASRRDGPPASWSTTPRPERSVIAILGGRGYGKTTVLRSILSDLAGPSHPPTVVLAPVCPEEFLAGDEPLGWIASALKTHVEQRTKELRASGMSDDALAIEDCFRAFNNRVQWFLLPRLRTWSSAADSPEALVDAMATASNSGASLRSALNSLCEALLPPQATATTLTAGGRLLVVTLDDVDLAPEHLDGILAVIPLLSSVDGVVVLVAADISLMRAHLRRSCGRHLDTEAARGAKPLTEPDSAEESVDCASGEMPTDPPTAERLAEDQLSKRFPLDLRFSIRPLAPIERLLFRPLGSDTTLASVLDGIEVHRGPLGPRTMLDFFDLSWNRVGAADPATHGTGYLDLLPSNPRALTSLHGLVTRHKDQLARVVANVPAGVPLDAEGSEYPRAFLAFLRDFLEAAAIEIPNGLPILSSVYRFSMERDLVIEARGYSGGTRESSMSLFEESKDVARIFYAHYASGRGGADLSLAAAALVRFSSEIDWLPVRGGFRNRYEGPGGVLSAQKPLIDPKSGLGWTIPNWDSMLMFESWHARWRDYVQRLAKDRKDRGGGKKFSRDEEAAVRLSLFRGYCAAITQMARRGAPKLSSDVPSGLEFDPVDPVALAGEIAADILEVDRMFAATATSNAAVARLHSDLLMWATLHLAVLSHHGAALHPAVADAAAALRERVRVLMASRPGLPTPEQWSRTAREGTSMVERALDGKLEIDLDTVDWPTLTARLVQNDASARRAALTILSTTEFPDDPRVVHLARLCSRLGIPIPSTESTAKPGPTSGASLSSESN